MPRTGDVDPERLLTLAYSIADPRSSAMLLVGAEAGGKHRDGYKRIRDAVCDGDAYCVEVHQDILAADGDFDAETAAEHLAGLIRERGYTPVIVASGRAGHRHVIARIPKQDDMRRLSDRASTLGFDVRRGGSRIRPPLSPHPSHLPVALISPLGVLEAAEALHCPLPTRWQTALRTGVTRGERSNRIQGFLTAIVPLRSKQWTWVALMDPKNGLGEKVRDTGAVALLDRVARAHQLR